MYCFESKTNFELIKNYVWIHRQYKVPRSEWSTESLIPFTITINHQSTEKKIIACHEEFISL